MRRPPLPEDRADRPHEFARPGKHSREPALPPASLARTPQASPPNPVAALGGISDTPPRSTVPPSDRDRSTSSFEICSFLRHAEFFSRGSGREVALLRFRVLNQLQIQADRHLIYDRNPARFHRLVPDNPELLPADLSACFEADLLVSARIADRCRRSLHVQNHLLRYSVDGQIARHFEFALTRLLHSLRLKLHRRIVGHIEKIGGLELRVALGHSRVHRGAVNRRFHGIPRRILRIVSHRSSDAREFTAHR